MTNDGKEHFDPCESADEEGECECCVDGRFMEAVNCYASTCDGCMELTSHVLMTMDEETQLGYCEACEAKRERERGGA